MKKPAKWNTPLAPTTMDSFTDFMAFIQSCPRVGESWLHRFEEYRRHGSRPEKCVERTESFSSEFKRRVDAIKNDPSCGLAE